MPCLPAKARHLFKSGKAKPKRNKLGLFYVQLCYEQGRWEAKACILAQLLRIMPLTDVKEGWQTKELRERYGLKKTTSKSKQSFESHAVDGWVLAASVSGALTPTCQRLWYVVPARLHRRQLHRLQASKGGIRKPYGSTRALGLKRGTVVRHKKYGVCTVGGVDRKTQTISLHAYQTNKRLTQAAKVKTCRVLTWVAWRSWLIAKEPPKKSGKGCHPTHAPRKERLVPPPHE
jgi:hypothetical protein